LIFDNENIEHPHKHKAIKQNFMKKQIFKIIVLSLVFFSSCKESNLSIPEEEQIAKEVMVAP
jgi:hypothetical protein